MGTYEFFSLLCEQLAKHSTIHIVSDFWKQTKNRYRKLEIFQISTAELRTSRNRLDSTLRSNETRFNQMKFKQLH